MATSSGLRGDAARLKAILSILRQRGATRGLTPEKLRLVLEDLGPTFMKIGQLLSLRSDMIPREYCQELAKLRTEAAPMPLTEVRAAVENELGAPLTELFSRFDEAPLGSASIAQAHRATLKSGESVVVKVQRPGIYETMEQDIALLRRAAGLLKLAAGTGETIDFSLALDELWAVSQQEMDFLREAANAEEFYQRNEGVAFASCPKIYRAFTTRHVLTMEYIDGFSPDDLEALDRAGYDRAEIAAKLADNYIKQIVDDGFFHADPHPGNLRIRGGQILWIDLGMMGRLSPRDQKLLGEAVRAISHHDVDAMRRVLLALGQPKGPVDHAQINADIDALLSRYAETDLESVSMPQLLDDVLALAKRHGIALPPGMSMLARGLSTIEGVVVALDPHFNIMRATAAHISRGAFTPEAARKKLKSAAASVYDSLDKSLDLPALAADWLKAFNRGGAKLNLELSPSEGLARALLALGDRLILSLLALALLTGGALLCANGPAPFALGASALGLICVALGLCLSVGLILSILRKRK